VNSYELISDFHTRKLRLDKLKVERGLLEVLALFNYFLRKNYYICRGLLLSMIFCRIGQKPNNENIFELKKII
jgi:hypothetical protein